MQIATALFKTEKSPHQTLVSSHRACVGRNVFRRSTITLSHLLIRGQA